MSKNWGPAAAAAAIRHLYLHILERNADDSGLVSYACQLDRGEKSVRDIVRTLGTSNEYEERLVRPFTPIQVAEKMYRHFLARKPENDQVVQGHARAIAEKGWKKVALDFIDSKEYTQRFGDDSVPG